MNVPSHEQTLLLKKGDALLLTPESSMGRPAILDDHDRVMLPASIGITLPEVFRDVRPGEAVWFDDGKIGGVVRAVDAERITVARISSMCIHYPAGTRVVTSDRPR